MKNYTHLTEQERYHIYIMRKHQYSITCIAKTMDRNPSTTSRELKCNGKNDYHGRIPKRVDMNKRPAIVDTLSRLGGLVRTIF